MLFQDLLKRISEKLNQSQIPYMVIGGQAILVYGEPRFTEFVKSVLFQWKI